MELAYYIGAILTSIMFLPMIWMGLWGLIRYDDRGYVIGGAALVAVSVSVVTVPLLAIVAVIWPLACLFGLAYWWDIAWNRYCCRGGEDE